MLLVALLLGGCKQDTTIQAPVSLIGIQDSFELLDKTTAATRITQDTKEGFFQKVNKTDLRIQLKLQETDNTTKDDLLVAYKKLLENNCATFNESEQKYVLQTLATAKQLADKINPAFCRNPIQLIKYTGDNYGKGTYYTRENRIILPADKLKEKNRNPTAFLETMLHEIFHIYSRYHQAERERLYRLIGFEPVTGDIKMPIDLNQRLLINPDGMNINYAINLTDEQARTFKAIPIIYSMNLGHNPKKTTFLNHLSFDLFEIEPQERNWKVKTNETKYLSSIFSLKNTGFHEQIGSNTDYVIHPDEVLADNFALLALSKKDPSSLEELSKEGVELLNKIETILSVEKKNSK